MSFDLSHDDAIPAFTLTCPGYRSGCSHDGSASSCGNLSFMIGNDVIAEIDHADLLESWQAAVRLSAAEAARMTEAAGHHLAEILDGGLATADLTEAVTDAAVVFLLAMKRYGISDPKRIPACTVMWHGHDGQGHVLLGA
jgi:hypothetical protein